MRRGSTAADNSAFDSWLTMRSNAIFKMLNSGEGTAGPRIGVGYEDYITPRFQSRTWVASHRLRRRLATSESHPSPTTCAQQHFVR